MLLPASHVHCILFHGPNKITLSVCLSVLLHFHCHAYVLCHVEYVTGVFGLYAVHYCYSTGTVELHSCATGIVCCT